MSFADPQSETPDAVGCKPPCFRADALAVVMRLRAAGHIAYFAGGCVRDLLLGKTPKDYDVATDAVPKRVRELFNNTQAVGVAFGVILVRLAKSVIEVATFRSDGEYLDGRRPSEVRFTTAEHDAQRRDFTINGLFLDPVADQVIDYVGGQADLQAKVIRAIGIPDQRFHEDHLRLLRAVRFAARLQFEIEPQTARSICALAPQLARISPERICEELRLMLTPVTRAAAWQMLVDYGLAAVVFRLTASVLPAEAATDRPAGTIFAGVSPGEAVPLGLALAAASLDWAWSHSSAAADVRSFLQKPRVREVCRLLRQTLRMSNEENDHLTDALEGLAPLLTDTEPRPATLMRFLARLTSSLSRAVLAAIRPALRDLDRLDWLQQQLAILDQIDYAPAPFVTGDDLTAAGLRPGPMFKRVLEATYDEQLEGRATTRDAALAFALAAGRA